MVTWGEQTQGGDSSSVAGRAMGAKGGLGPSGLGLQVLGFSVLRFRAPGFGSGLYCLDAGL